MNRIGFYFADVSRKGVPEVPTTISSWAKLKAMDLVIWTGLPRNFKEETGTDFSVDAAIRHLQGLPPEAKAMAAEHIWRAPDLVQRI